MEEANSFVLFIGWMCSLTASFFCWRNRKKVDAIYWLVFSLFCWEILTAFK